MCDTIVHTIEIGSYVLYWEGWEQIYIYTTQQEDNNIVKSQIINDWGCGGGMGQPLKVHGI